MRSCKAVGWSAFAHVATCCVPFPPLATYAKAALGPTRGNVADRPGHLPPVLGP